MLIPAQLRQDELRKLFTSVWYDEKFMYFYDGTGRNLYQSDDNCYYSRQFCSVDEDDNIVGYIGYNYNNDNRSANNFGLCAFKNYNQTFFDDVIVAIYELFYKFKLDRVEFLCFDGNPAVRGYRSFIKRYGGREVARLRRVCRLMDGELHDSFIFEVLVEDLKVIPGTGITKLHDDYDKIMSKHKKKELEKTKKMLSKSLNFNDPLCVFYKNNNILEEIKNDSI